MHEANFTEQIVQAVISELEKHPRHKPKRVHVNVGEMLHLEPESVRLHFTLLAKGTRLEGAELDLSETPVSVQCASCHEIGTVEDHHFPMCATCGSLEVKMLSGQEVSIDAIDMECEALD